MARDDTNFISYSVFRYVDDRTFVVGWGTCYGRFTIRGQYATVVSDPPFSSLNMNRIRTNLLIVGEKWI